MKTDATTAVYASAQEYRSAGEIIGGLVALKVLSEELFVILPGELIRTRSSDVRVSETGIVVQGRDVIPFAGTTTWEGYSGNACVNFTITAGDREREGIIAPATRPADMDVGREITRFFRSCDQGDHFHVYDLDGRVPDGDDTPESKLFIRADAPGKSGYDDGDAMVVLGNRLPLAEMTWAEIDEDGDGNRYLHLVMTDGRYRRICAGEFDR